MLYQAPTLWTHPNRRTRKPKKHPEADLQKECVAWFRRFHKNELLFSVPNESAAEQAAHFKELGLLKGVSDLIAVLNGGRILFLEFKAVNGKQSREQRAFQLKVERLGFKYYIIRTKQSFINAITDRFNQSL